MSTLLLAVGAGALAQRNKEQEANVRSVQGAVRDESDRLIEGAVVQLKNTKNLQIRSFITQKDGAYHFHGLSTNVDYELRAEYGGMTSPVRTLSTFDSRRTAIINLKLERKK